MSWGFWNWRYNGREDSVPISIKAFASMRSAIENSCAPEGSVSPEHLEAGDGKVSIIELLTILGRDKAVLLRASLGMALFAVVLALVLPPTFRASTSVL